MSRTTALVVLCLVHATGCYESHQGTLLDGGPPPDGAADGAINDGAIADAPPGSDGATPDPATGFLIASLTIPEPSAGVAPGANVDGLDSGGGSSDPSATCEELNIDFVAPDGTRGVDDTLGQLVPTLRSLLPGGDTVDEMIADAIAAGELLIGIELVDHSVVLYALEPTAPIAVDPDGVPTAGQQFVAVDRIGMGASTTMGGRTRVELGDLQLAVSGEIATILGDGVLHRVELRFTRNAIGLTEGELGATATVEELVAAWTATDPGSEPTVRSVLASLADVDPKPTEPEVCQSISMGMRFQAVPATFVHR